MFWSSAELRNGNARNTPGRLAPGLAALNLGDNSDLPGSSPIAEGSCCGGGSSFHPTTARR